MIPKQIGWSQKALLYYEVLKEFGKLSSIMSKVVIDPPSSPDYVVTLNGDIITSVDGKSVLTVNGFVSL